MKKLTRDEFIARSEAVHGKRYDYSWVEYVNNSTKVEILCPVHGPFLQTPAKHMKGCGCPDMDCINARRDATCMARYGVKNPGQAASVRAKMAATSLARYGTDNPMRSDTVKSRLKASVLAKYGVDCTFRDPGTRAKIDAALVAKYGGRSPMCSREVRSVAESTMLSRYGVRHALQSDDIRRKQEATLEARFGVTNPMRSPEVRAGLVATYRVRYGTDWPLGAQEVRELAQRTKLERGTFNSSSSEEAFYARLRVAFGVGDVVRQYRSDAYPFACDFYIKPRDMYVELNASWTHGGHWFEGSDPEDAAVLDSWKVLGRSSRYYGNAVHVWAERDVLKRETARKNALNYIVFWDYNLKDANLWFAEGCPDGHDYEQPYSWLDLDARPVRNS